MAAEPRAAEWWMISNVGTGVATASFLNLLLPPYILDVTGSALRVGIVFAVISLSAVIGPWVGVLAERTGRYRLVYLLSLLGMAGAFALLAIDSTVAWYSPLVGVLIGVSYAAQGTLGPTFIVGAGLSEATVAKQLVWFNLAYPIGQLIGAVIVGVSQIAGVGPQAMLWIATATLVVFAAATWPGLRLPTERVAAATARTPIATQSVGTATGPVPLRIPGQRTATRVPFSAVFWVFLVVVLVSSLGNNGLTSQLANVMPAVYGFSNAGTSLLLGLAGLLNIAVLIVAGRWMIHAGPLTVYVAGTALRAIGAITMAVIGLFTNPILILAGVAMLVTYQAVPIPRLAASEIAAQLAPTGMTARANGMYFAASALGSVLGCLGAGLLAGFSFEAVVWLAALAGSSATLVALAWTRSARSKAV